MKQSVLKAMFLEALEAADRKSRESLEAADPEFLEGLQNADPEFNSEPPILLHLAWSANGSVELENALDEYDPTAEGSLRLQLRNGTDFSHRVHRDPRRRDEDFLSLINEVVTRLHRGRFREGGSVAVLVDNYVVFRSTVSLAPAFPRGLDVLVGTLSELSAEAVGDRSPQLLLWNASAGTALRRATEQAIAEGWEFDATYRDRFGRDASFTLDLGALKDVRRFAIRAGGSSQWRRTRIDG